MDSIANFLNALKLASRAGKGSFVFPASKHIAAIADALVKHRYLVSAAKKGKKGRLLELTLLPSDGAPKVSEAKRVSRLSKRVYRKASELRSVRNGFGLALLSTPRGILSDTEARAARVGGEVLCEIW